MKSKSERQEAVNGGRVREMDFMVVLVCYILMSCWVTSEATSLITGQRVCRVGPGRPCYKLAYFSDFRRRLNFVEAGQACKRDGGELLSVESPSEQRIIEELVTELRPTDGDFWIGLRRDHRDEDNNAECSAEYYWVDGSESTFRNWHWDEPSCGYEVCVVMYHQPSASAGLGEMYMFQWNDDNCETKNNFICKYTTEKSLEPFPSSNVTAPAVALPTPLQPQDPNNHGDKEKIIALNWMHILLPTIPLVLLFLTLLAVCCFRLCGRRRKRRHQKSEVCQTEPTFPPPSPAPDDVYNVIRSQKDDDLSETRPQTKNTSFLCLSSPDTPTGDYDNLPGRDTESGFVTLASTESCFLSLELNDLSLGRRGNRDLYDNSLGRSGKRDIHDGSLGRNGNQRESYDHRSLGRRTGRSELYAAWERETEEERVSLARRSDLYEPSYDPARPTLKADIYQTYLSNGRKDIYQTNVVPYANRKSYHGYYSNEPSLSSTGRYYNEADWVNSNGFY